MIGIGAVVCVVAIGRAGRARRGTTAEPGRELRLDRSRLPLSERSAHWLARDHAPHHGRCACSRPGALIKRMTPNVDGSAHVRERQPQLAHALARHRRDLFRDQAVGRLVGAHFLENDVISARSVVLIGETSASSSSAKRIRSGRSSGSTSSCSRSSACWRARDRAPSDPTRTTPDPALDYRAR